jgi:hypothetical protein
MKIETKNNSGFTPTIPGMKLNFSKSVNCDEPLSDQENE